MPGFSNKQESVFSHLRFCYAAEEAEANYRFQNLAIAVEVEAKHWYPALTSHESDRIAGIAAGPFITGVYTRVLPDYEN